MAPFIVLFASFLFFRIVGFLGLEYFSEWENSLTVAVVLMFVLTASAHWGKRRAGLIQMVPPSLPNPSFIVTMTGIFEIIGAVGLLIPITSKVASLSLAFLLIVMFPANIRAANKKITIAGRSTPSLLPRTILQIIFIAAVVLAG